MTIPNISSVFQCKVRSDSKYNEPCSDTILILKIMERLQCLDSARKELPETALIFDGRDIARLIRGIPMQKIS